MKLIPWLLLTGVALVATSITDPPGSIIGQWQQKFAGDISVRTVYRADNTFDIFVNGKTFVSGQYKVSQDTLSISDPVCGVGYYGTYRLAFITPDSVRQTLVLDTCQVRRNSISRSPASGRIKKTKP